MYFLLKTGTNQFNFTNVFCTRALAWAFILWLFCGQASQVLSFQYQLQILAYVICCVVNVSANNVSFTCDLKQAAKNFSKLTL